MTDIALIEAAARRLQGHVRRTPLRHAPLLDRQPPRCSAPACLKPSSPWPAAAMSRPRPLPALSGGSHHPGPARRPAPNRRAFQSGGCPALVLIHGLKLDRCSWDLVLPQLPGRSLRLDPCGLA
ncbi:hypothetical protein [Tabrizicola sp.]|uniref:hypothetical protein n=1 Tax=Tabrizicola sp. TaxID=2005166 RepID=UPI0025CFC47D|nr:hypothetical protein [Tabrizicola sp.]MBY0351465.1 hypothetical protein [Tabrizicola sp.]